MRLIYFLMIISSISLKLNLYAQSGCPIGYELRNVKCVNSSSGMTQRCIPADYKCNACWVTEWPKCNSIERGGSENSSTYEGALRVAETNRKDFQSTTCTGTNHIDYNRFTIYISGGDYCSESHSNVSGSGASDGEPVSGNGLPEIKIPKEDKGMDQVKDKVQFQKDKEQLKTSFGISYTNALRKLRSIKEGNPQKATGYNDNYWQKIQYYQDLFQKEYDKNEKADMRLLKQLIIELDHLVESMALVADADLKGLEDQKQQYQNKADTYLSKAQEKEQSPITQNVNMDLAKVNATMAGNNQQVQNIQISQNQQRYENNVAVISSIKDLGSSYFQNKLQNDLNKIEGFYNQQKANSSKRRQLRIALDQAYESSNIDDAFSIAVALANAYAEEKINDIQMEQMTWENKNYKYFLPTSKSIIQTYNISQLPERLPDLLRVPTLRSFRNDFPRLTICDTAFGFLRDCNAVTVYFQGVSYKIKCAKKVPIPLNEDSAIVYLKKVIALGNIQNPYDLFDYQSANLWVAYLQNKKAKSLGDLYDNVNFIQNYFRKIRLTYRPDFSISYDEMDYMEYINQAMLFFLQYDYLMIYKNTQDENLKSELFKNLKALRYFGTTDESDYSQSISTKGKTVLTDTVEKIFQEFNNL